MAPSTVNIGPRFATYGWLHFATIPTPSVRLWKKKDTGAKGSGETSSPARLSSPCTTMRDRRALPSSKRWTVISEPPVGSAAAGCHRGPDGAAYTVWNVFGEPDGLQFVAAGTGQGDALLGGMGTPVQASAGQTVLLALRFPRVLAEPWSPFSTADAQTTPREVRVWRITPAGSEMIASWDGQTQAQGLQVDSATGIAWLLVPGPGRYHLEVRIQPLHLTAALKGAAPFAQLWYRWAVTNAIEIQ